MGAAETDDPEGRRGESEAWGPEHVRALRERIGLTQAEMAERVGTRQQTISEWETGARVPRPMSRRLLQMVAEDAGFYDAGQRPVAPVAPAGEEHVTAEQAEEQAAP